MNLRERDKKHLWHPLTQHQLHSDHLPIIGAEGAILFDDKGREYIDGIASWYTAMYGHCNPFITDRVANQMRQLDHTIFTGFTHKPAIELSEELISILPSNQQKIFFSDNGSTAVDVALKMAFQYHFNRGERRDKVIALENGFHGDTFGAMSVSNLSVYNGVFNDFFFNVDRIPPPTKNNFKSVKERFAELIKNYDVAAFIYEPLVQGAAGMKMYDGALLDDLLSLAKQHDVLTIADEVMTGFGKTGKNFASEHLQNYPDIICLSKSLTAGFVPMAITSCSQIIYDAFLSKNIDKGFFHGHTYSANPIACTAALAGIELLKSDEIQQNIQRIIQSHRQFDRQIKKHPKVRQTRQLGVIYALDLETKMERYGNLRDIIFRFFMENGVFLRPLGNTIYILPPFIIEDQQLQKIYQTVFKALSIF